jgi:hypothetical protein
MNSQARIIPPREIAYPDSLILRGLEWIEPAQRYPGSGTDMHWWTWGDDGALYFVDDDGANFGLPWNFGHLLRATGDYPDFKLEEVSHFPDLKRYSIDKVRYVDGALAVGSRLYVAAYDYNYLDPGHEVYRLVDQVQRVDPPDEGFFMDANSRLGGVAALMYSDDYGVTWQNTPGEDTPYFLGKNFAGLAFVGFGPGYTKVPGFLGDFVYAISNDENWENGNHVFLARAPKNDLLDRSKWEFYIGGRDFRTPTWSREEAAARPILSDPGHVGHPTMTYSPRLRRFLLTFGSDVVTHSYATPRDYARAHWHRQRELHIYESTAPWGPWYLVHYENNWEGEHVAYLPQIPGKWLSPDGLQGVMVFSGDYSMVPRPAGYQSFYGFMTRPFRLIPR